MLKHGFVTIIAFLIFVTSSFADEFGTKDDAIKMVKSVQEMLAKDGPEATFKAINEKHFIDRDLYPFVYKFDGTNVAHGANAALVGKVLIDLKDQNGKFLIREMIAIAKDSKSGWVDYMWPNPTTKKIEAKSSYVEAAGDYVVGVGVYRNN